MIPAKTFVDRLTKRGFTRFTGVPCSFFQDAINYVIDDPALRYTMVPNEGVALAVASGAHLAGRPTVVMIQNAGLGNLVNPLTSLNLIYRLPVLLFLSGRAYGIADEPQHEVMGRTMGSIFDAIGVPHRDMPMDEEAYDAVLEEATAWMERERQPFVLFVREGTIGTYASQRSVPVQYPLKRIEAIRLVAEALEGPESVIVTTGKPSRELFSVCDRKKNFYMQGSMGHAAGIGLGVALNRPMNKVVILDGDGALLMHLGILSSIGHYRPDNLYHVVLDNESYETTGDQDTTSSTTDLCAVAKSCGYLVAEEAKTEQEVREQLRRILSGRGPAFLRIKINRLPTPSIPRITTKYTSRQIAETFQATLTGNGS